MKCQIITTILLCTVFITVHTKYAKDSGCPSKYECQSTCKNITSKTVIYPCIKNDKQMLCCPSEENYKPSAVEKSNLFPDICGDFSLEDRIVGGQIADLGQFPFMALLGYTIKNIPQTEYLCGGSIITNRYILTAAHCLKQKCDCNLTSVRLGEHNLTSTMDCVSLDGEENFCSDPPVDIEVELTTIHPKFDITSVKHDIALIKLKQAITFTNFIKPICLPFGIRLQSKNLEGSRFEVAGWGRYSSTTYGGSSVLQYASVTVWNIFNCSNAVPPEAQPIQNTQLCANGKKAQDACKGDSGGPLFNRTIEKAAGKTYQIGIVSFAGAKVCGDVNVPTIYTRVGAYLKWIKENVK